MCPDALSLNSDASAVHPGAGDRARENQLLALVRETCAEVLQLRDEARASIIDACGEPDMG
ncbi:MAG TPA: hypothetical protein VLN59_01900 [Burkholderiales bacterium]|nr:hypothetical protein [Burkholderiales bacterium]